MGFKSLGFINNLSYKEFHMQKTLFYLILVTTPIGSLQAQEKSLQELLWEQVDGKPTDIQLYGKETQIIDDENNGYLQIEKIEEGCGCYFRTTVGAYKKADDTYAFLKMEEDGCNWRKNLSTGSKLNSILPKNFELPEFLSEEAKKTYADNNSFPIFYLEVDIPREGTDTKVHLAYIPFGARLSNRNDVLALTGYSKLNNEGKSNYTYSGNLYQFLKNIQDEETLSSILKGNFTNINSIDYDLAEKIVGKDKLYASMENLATDLRNLQVIYRYSKQIAFKTIIFGWDAENAKFYIKEKIKNDDPEQSFLEFVKELPFLMAVC